MSFYELARLDVTTRPLSAPIPLGHRRSLFSASMASTVRLLATELRALDAKRVVLELDVPDRMLRLDGLPRADARPNSPAVALAFESRFGPLRYETGEFTTWQDNLRAIALSVQALRAVDRYGVSRRGEQYRGRRALPTSTDPADAIQTREQAQAFLREWNPGGVDDWSVVVRRAIGSTHPDHGGDPSEFRKVMRAKELLGSAS